MWTRLRVKNSRGPDCLKDGGMTGETETSSQNHIYKNKANTTNPEKATVKNAAMDSLHLGKRADLIGKGKVP